tara:strand:+ start:156838 stop:158031 length:1194 start_codon:yes stop_codon:yes gene_type:complete
MKALNIIGGTYVENCYEPQYNNLFGSGFRGAQALAEKSFNINFYSCIGSNWLETAQYNSEVLGINSKFLLIERSVEWDYYHPLSPPVAINLPSKIYDIPRIKGENFLYYGMIEAQTKIEGNYVVYDPQNHKSFKETRSTAKHLALILNKKEALLFSDSDQTNLEGIGKSLLSTENAEVVVIKNGSQGALVFHKSEVTNIPVFETEKVWPIGTGDIFSAVFAWKWIIEKCSPHQSAFEASKHVAHYCQTRTLPLNLGTAVYQEITNPSIGNKIYLAGPFFSIGERYLINEFRNSLMDFGNRVFSPYHDAGILMDDYTNEQAKQIAEIDLKQIEDCNVVLAVATGKDLGTSVEIGYALSLGKKVIVFAENLNRNDLPMLIGTGCEVIEDFSTAVYKASW